MHVNNLFRGRLLHNAAASELQTSDITFFISPFCLYFLCNPLSFTLFSLPVFHLSIHQKFLFIPFPIIFWSKQWRSLTMTTFSLSIRFCLKMSANKSPSSLFTCISTVMRRSLSGLNKSKASTIFYATFAGPMAKSCQVHAQAGIQIQPWNVDCFLSPNVNPAGAMGDLRARKKTWEGVTAHKMWKSLRKLEENTCRVDRGLPCSGWKRTKLMFLQNTLDGVAVFHGEGTIAFGLLTQSQRNTLDSLIHLWREVTRSRWKAIFRGVFLTN